MTTSQIILKADLSIDEVIHKIKMGICQNFEFFPDKIMSGKIYGNKINATINSPVSISDPFKTKVNGHIVVENDNTKVELILSFGIVNKLILIIWYLPMISLLQHEKNQDFYSILRIFGMLSLLSFISFLLLWIKLKWDKRKLEKWLIKTLNDKK